MVPIRSGGNAQFKALSKLVQSSRERKQAGMSVLEGAHLVSVYRDRVGLPERIVVSPSGLKNPEIRALLARTGGLTPFVLDDHLFEKVSSVVTPTGIMAVIKTPHPRLDARQLRACVMVDALQDPGNLGSILRSAAAAGIADVLLSPNSVLAWSPRVLRAAMGAHFLLKIHEGVELVSAMTDYQGRVIATSQQARQSVFETDLTGDVALLFGNEGGGITPRLKTAANVIAAIPMPGGAESINVAAAAAVCLFERVRQLSLKRDR